MVFPTKNDDFGVFWGYHHLRKHLNHSVVGKGILGAVLVHGWQLTDSRILTYFDMIGSFGSSQTSLGFFFNTAPALMV